MVIMVIVVVVVVVMIINKTIIYSCNENKLDCLDECNRHSQHIIDGYKYHYHINYNYNLTCLKGLLLNYYYQLYNVNHNAILLLDTSLSTSTFTNVYI